MEVTAGGGQSAYAGAALSESIAVTVRDGKGMLVPNTSAVFAVVAGGGSVTPASVVTDKMGVAGGVTWTLGTRGGEQKVTVTVDTVVKTILATVRSSFVVTLRFFGPPMSLEAQTAFTNAANRLRAAIITNLTPVELQNAGLKSCPGPDITLNEITSGVIIYASVGPIDGPGKYLAQAGPCWLRGNNLPAVGVMQFDEADIQNYITTGRFEALVLHEMNHVVGFGTIWTDKNLLQNPAFTNTEIPQPTGSTNPRFTGAASLAQCLSAGGSVNHCAAGVGVAVEQCGNAGTADGHWRENFGTICPASGGPATGSAAFDAELMTGFAEGPGVAMPWSTTSIASLQDLGYTVNLLAADPFVVPNLLTMARLRTAAEAESGEHPIEIVMRPRFTVGGGRIQAISREVKR